MNIALVNTVKNTKAINSAVSSSSNNITNSTRVELEIGDEIIYESKYGQRKYIVQDKKEILETDWSMLKQTKDNRLTLITCIKNKVNQRLCVQAVQQEI